MSCPCTKCEGCGCLGGCVHSEDKTCVCVRCPTCNELVIRARLDYGYTTCMKHSSEKTKDHQPGVVNSLGLHEKYFPEGR